MRTAIAIMGYGESTPTVFWIAAVLMTAGVWLHLTEGVVRNSVFEAG